MQAPARLTRVLLADDSEGLRLLVRSWLTAEDDLEVVAEATNGAEAVALADAYRPDVVVLDVAMPVMDGLQALTELQRRFPQMPVVMHSGFAEGQVARQAIARGAHAFVEKSGDLEPLVAALRRATAPVAPPLPEIALEPAPEAPRLTAAPDVVTAPEPVPVPEPLPAVPAPPGRSLVATVVAVLALAALAVGGPSWGHDATPLLLLLVVPVAVLALRHGQVGGVPGAAAATAASATWALAVPSVSAAYVLACGVAAGTVGIALGGSVDSRRRAEEHQRKVSDAVVASNRALAEANDRLGRLNADLQTSNDDLQQFGQIAGHDLVEPLRSIGSFSQLLDARYASALDDRGRQYLRFIGDGVSRMQALVDDLRSYTRAGQAALTRQPVDLAEVVDDVRAGLRLLLVERRAQLRVGPLPVVPGDRTLLGLVLQNVVVNALTFNSSAAPVVEISAERTGGRWAVRISDDGIGLDLDECESVFGLFTRLHTREEYPGTGLGLAIAKRIIERHDGAIALAPRPGGGTTVTLTLPALETPA